jgi:O-Antigen ligase.
MTSAREESTIERVSRLGFLALVFSLAFMKPSIILVGHQITPTDLIFPFAIFLLIASYVLGKARFKWNPAYWFFLTYFAALAISAFSSEFPSANLAKLLGVGYLIGLAVLASQSIRSEEDVRSTIRVWLGGLAVSVVIGIATAAGSNILADNSFFDTFTYHQGAAPAGAYRRISSTFISPGMFCNYLNVGLFLTFIGRAKGWLSDKVAVLLVATIILCSFLTVTIGIGTVLLSGGVLLWLTNRDDNPLIAKTSLTFGFLAFVAFFLTAFIALQPHRTAPYSFHIPLLGIEAFPSPRLLVWQQALDRFLAYPFTGVGTGSPVAQVLFQNADGSMSLLTDAHNFLLNIAAQAGIVGLISLVAIFVYIMQLSFTSHGERDIDIVKIGLGLALLAGLGIQGLTGSFEDARHLWVLIGIIVAVDRYGRPSID